MIPEEDFAHLYDFDRAEVACDSLMFHRLETFLRKSNDGPVIMADHV